MAITPETAAAAPADREAGITLSRPSGDTLLVGLSGAWLLRTTLPEADELRRELSAGAPTKGVSFDTHELGKWDSALITFLLEIFRLCQQQGIEIDQTGLPDGLQKLLHLATAVPPKKDARKEAKPPPLLARIGEGTLEVVKSSGEMVSFLGEATLAFARLIRGKAQYRKVDLALVIQETGPQA